MKFRVWALLACGACNPGQALQQQVGYATSKDYTQMALDEKRKSDDRAAQEAARQKVAQDEIDRHARAGQGSLDLGEYDAAVKELGEAYRLSNDPKFLPLVATATRRTGDCSRAKSLYQEYLNKAPGAADRVAVEAKLREAETCEKNLGNNFEKVRDHYQKGVTHYELSEYDQAAGEFKEAYRLSKDPTYLYNIAQAYRQGKNCGEAGKFYQRYLSAVPDAENREKLEGYVAEMKKCAR